MTSAAPRRAARQMLAPLVVLAGIALLASACGGTGGPTAPEGTPAGAAAPEVGGPLPRQALRLGDTRFRATKIGSAAGLPTALVGSPDGGYLLVGVVTGQVDLVALRRRDGVTAPVPLPDPWLDISDRTRFDGANRGLLGLAVVDDGRRIAVGYTALNGDVTVETFPWTGRPTASRSDGRVAFRAPHPLSGLSGGGIAVLRDGDLVLGIGDMDDRFGRPPAAQDPTSPLGSLVRIGRRALQQGSNAPFDPDQLLAKGLRNPWGVSVDPPTGDIWTGDVGDHLVEEVDRVGTRPATARVPNFGWPWLEGTAAGVPGRPAGVPLTAPVIADPHRFEVCGVVGGVVYRGRRLPWLEGTYLFGDLCSNKVQAAVVRKGKVVQRQTVGEISGKVVAFGRDGDGEVYALATNGSVFRLDPPTWKVRPVATTIGPPAAPPAATTTTTTAATGRPPAYCGIIDVFAELEPVTTLSPEQVRRLLPRVRRLLDDAVAASTGRLRDDLSRYRTYVEQWISFGEQRGWDFTDDALAGYFGRVTSGAGEFAGAPALIDRLIESVATCPGQQL